MGYTHSWYRKPVIETGKMKKICKDFEKVIEKLPIENAIAKTETRDFPVGEDDIVFGGLGGDVEPFILLEKSAGRVITKERAREQWQEGKVFEYCKTEHCPYDLAVTAILLIMKKHLKDEVRIYTDGEEKDWKKAVDICQRTVGFGAEIRIQNREIVL